MSKALSSFNKAQVVSRQRMYSDFDISMNFHPGLKDIRPVVDLDAIRNSVKNLVLTGPGDHPFHTEIGCGIFYYLFEPADIFTNQRIATTIQSMLLSYEPRIDSINVTVTDKDSLNSYHITIEFRVKSASITTSTSFYLERLR